MREPQGRLWGTVGEPCEGVGAHDGSRKVLDDEAALRVVLARARAPWRRAEGVLLVLEVDLEEEGGLGGVGRAALMVEQVEDAIGRRGDQVDAARVVDAQGLVAHERQHVLRAALEDMRDEERVEALVGKVDAELLECVLVERLEAEDVEQPDGVAGDGAALDFWREAGDGSRGVEHVAELLDDE